MDRFKWFGLTVTISLVLPMILFVALWAADWPGAADRCLDNSRRAAPRDTCYCEKLNRSGIKQPANTWSNVGPILVGLTVLIYVAGFSTLRSDNPMTSDLMYQNLYGGLVVFLGPGSMYFHASMTRFGGWLDTLSMSLYIVFMVVYNVVRLFDASRSVFWLIYISLNVLFAILGWFLEGAGTVTFGIMLVCAIITEVIVHLTKIVRRRLLWLLVGLGIFAVAFLIWWLSHTDGPLCSPDSALQGHGVWHILCGLAAGCFFLYFRTETRHSTR